MTSRLNAALAASILDRVMELPARNSAIDVVADQVISEVELDDTAAPFEQAYQYAHAFRDQAVPTSAVRFDPESWLVATGVLVEDIRLGSRDVDAIAVWGPRHGPAILVNLDGRSSQFSSGRNTSLAHEIGHLLMDRAAALPVAEVLGGKVNPRVEQRARAFAAEVLLPRESAGEGFAGVASADDASRLVASLAARYRVSHEVVAWQVRNSDVPLHPPVFEYLRSLVTYPERF